MTPVIRDRWLMVALGCLFGLGFWGLFEVAVREVLTGRALAPAFAFLLAFGSATMSLAGPLPVRRALLAGLGVGILLAVLAAVVALRFADLEGLLNDGLHVAAGFAMVAILLPFLIGLHEGEPRHYPTLFDAAWGIAVRGAVAGVFCGIVFMVLGLSAELLDIVGVTVLSDLLAEDLFNWLLAGASFGLGIAVAWELRDLVSPRLILWLLRMLVPVVLVVMVVFIGALALQGLDELFVTFSGAGIMIAMVAGGATLVTVAIDRDDADATQSPLLRMSSRALALILPIPAAIAAYAVWLRVGQYGWTPERLFGAIAAVVAVLYGVGYALAAMRRAGWMERLRQVNIGMAGVVCAVSALWLTPALNAERISVNSQQALWDAGATESQNLAIWQFRGWGLAGEAFIADLEEQALQPGQEDLALALQQSEPWQDPSDDGLTLEQTVAALTDTMPLVPPTATASRDAVIAGLDEYEAAAWLRACKSAVQGRPRCVMVVADLLPATAGDEVAVITNDPTTSANFMAFVTIDGAFQRRNLSTTVANSNPWEAADAIIRALQDGGGSVVAVQMNGLPVDDGQLIINPW
jgi:hypothetical protein